MGKECRRRLGDLGNPQLRATCQPTELSDSRKLGAGAVVKICAERCAVECPLGLTVALQSVERHRLHRGEKAVLAVQSCSLPGISQSGL